MIRCSLLFSILIMVTINDAKSQAMPIFKDFPSLPNTEGMAGMFAGSSNGQLFCMGGANFPDKKPWEGGKKIWYDDIYQLVDESHWIKLEQKMPRRLAYGISAEYNGQILIVGGNDSERFYADVYGMTWKGNEFVVQSYPSLPVPLANMAGALVENLLIVAGGTSSHTGTPLQTIYALDMQNPADGWMVLPTWPGQARTQPVGGAYKGAFFLFSGEAIGKDHEGKPQRTLLQDGFRFRPEKIGGKWSGLWEALPTLPKAVSASANPVPVLSDGRFIFWGGVNAERALHKDPVTHPGIDQKIFSYQYESGSTIFLGTVDSIPAKVTLPTVYWKNHWLFLSGEIKPGIRTPSVIGIK